MYVVNFYSCSECGVQLGGFVQSTDLIPVHTLQQGDIFIRPEEAKISRVTLYCHQCVPLGFSSSQAKCRVCRKDTTFGYSEYGDVIVGDDTPILVQVTTSLFAVFPSLSWCSEECLGKEKGEVEIEVRYPMFAK